jgi:hypothetical protein
MVPVPGISQPVPMPASMVGVLSVDPAGRVTGSGTASIAGQAMPYQVLEGQVTPGDDCTAAVEMSVASGGAVDTGRSWLVMFRGGEELWAIQTASQTAVPVVAGAWTRIAF